MKLYSKASPSSGVAGRARRRFVHPVDAVVPRAAAEYPRREGTLTILDQGRVEIPISTIVRSGSEVSLSVKAVGGVYAGALNADATELAGTWTQGPLSVPLTFRRAAPTEPTK